MVTGDHFVCHVIYTIQRHSRVSRMHLQLETFETFINDRNPLIILVKFSISDVLGVLTKPLLVIAASACY